MKLAFNTVEQMSEGEEHLWHIELVSMRDCVKFALNNLDSLSKRNHVQTLLESVHRRLNELCEATRGEKE